MQRNLVGKIQVCSCSPWFMSRMKENGGARGGAELHRDWREVVATVVRYPPNHSIKSARAVLGEGVEL